MHSKTWKVLNNGGKNNESSKVDFHYSNIEGIEIKLGFHLMPVSHNQ